MVLLCRRSDSEVVLSFIVNELCVISDVVHLKTDICGDDRFSPGVKVIPFG